MRFCDTFTLALMTAVAERFTDPGLWSSRITADLPATIAATGS